MAADIRFKVSEKKALSMYGLGRFPVTLYASQWRTLLANVDGIRAALAQHAGELSEKTSPAPASTGGADGTP